MMTDQEKSNEQARWLVIADAIELDAASMSPDNISDGPGRLSGCSDRLLATALDVIAGHGFADDQGSLNDSGDYVTRIGRFLLWTDSQGFIDCETFDSDDLASNRFAQAILDAESDTESESDQYHTRESFVINGDWVEVTRDLSGEIVYAQYARDSNY